MQRTLSQIEADLASLRENVERFKRLAANHRAANNMPVANKLSEVASEMEARAEEMQRLMKTAAIT